MKDDRRAIDRPITVTCLPFTFFRALKVVKVRLLTTAEASEANFGRCSSSAAVLVSSVVDGSSVLLVVSSVVVLVVVSSSVVVLGVVGSGVVSGVVSSSSLF